MKKICTVMMCLLFLFASEIALAGDVFVIGIAPHTSPRVILEMYAPLRTYLEKSLDVSVEIVTAPNYEVLAQRGLAQEFDVFDLKGQP